MKQTIQPYKYLSLEAFSSLTQTGSLDGVKQEPTRKAYEEVILEVGKINPNVVVLDADNSRSVGTSRFKEMFPDRSFNFGIAEQNMLAAAAGMASTGLIPFVSAYAVFATMRALDQVRNSIHYPHLNVKIAASHGGITPSPDGVTHQCQEELAIMRTIANSTIIACADSISTKKAVIEASVMNGPVYLSFTRIPVPLLYDETYPFKIGKAIVIREGTDVTIIAIRDMVSQALIAAELLAKKGISARVIDMHTLKPIDTNVILSAARETGAIITVESGTIIGGLGSAVSEVLCEDYLVPLKRIGIKDTFAESGSYSDILEKYELTANHIVKAVNELLLRKSKDI
mgnify:CR=1 FL=1